LRGAGPAGFQAGLWRFCISQDVRVERAVVRATPPVLAVEGFWAVRAARECAVLPARPPAWQAWRLAPPCSGGLKWSAQSWGPDGDWNSRAVRDCAALPARPPAWQAWRLAPPSSGGLRWSAQSCGPDGDWNLRAVRDCVALPARPPAWQAWRLAPPSSGGLRWSAQSCGPRRQSWRRKVFGESVLLGTVLFCRRDRRHGKPGGLLHLAAAA